VIDSRASTATPRSRRTAATRSASTFVSASASATKIGFGDDPDAVAAYEEAVAGGYAVYYVGTATFVGGSL
jgi:hypothetical protein